MDPNKVIERIVGRYKKHVSETHGVSHDELDDTQKEIAKRGFIEQERRRSQAQAVSPEYAVALATANKTQGNNEIRKFISRWVIAYLFFSTTLVFTTILLDAFGVTEMDMEVLLALAGGMPISTIGVIGFMVQGLFGRKHRSDSAKKTT